MREAVNFNTLSWCLLIFNVPTSGRQAKKFLKMVPEGKRNP